MCIAFCRNKPTMAVLSIFVRSFVVVFADLFFLYFFLPVCLICYFITRSTAIRNAVLVVFSLIFYAWGEPVWVSILIVSSLVDYINGRVIEKHPEGWQAHGLAQFLWVCGIILTSQAIQISLSVLAGYSASTLMRTLNILLSAKLSQSSGRGGISPLAHFSEIMCFISLSSAKEENTEDFSLYGSAQDFGTAQAGTLFSGDFTMECSYSLKCS